MREAKLKAWVKERKIMADVLIINYKESTVQLPIETDVTDDYWWDETVWSFEEIELLQYTGLTDKNGKEIYEGDVVKYLDVEFSFIAEVAWSDWMWYLEGINPKESFMFDDVTDNETADVEIIGNIFQHPHLLEGTNSIDKG